MFGFFELFGNENIFYLRIMSFRRKKYLNEENWTKFNYNLASRRYSISLC